MRFLIVLTALFLATACTGQPVYRTSSTPLPVAQVDINEYDGLWHEAARLPNAFEQGCLYATANYTQRPDGKVGVENRCRDAQGREQVARGTARAVGEGKFKVSFFWPIEADYWVLERAPDYSWAIVGEPSGRYLWVLTRSANLDERTRAFFETRITALGYRPAEMVWAANPNPESAS